MLNFQHHTKLCYKCTISSVSSLHLSPVWRWTKSSCCKCWCGTAEFFKPEFTVAFPAAKRLGCQKYLCFPTISEMWVRYVRNGKHYKLRIVTTADLWSKTTDTEHPLTYNFAIILLAAFLHLSLRPNVIIPRSDFPIFLVDIFNTASLMRNRRVPLDRLPFLQPHTYH